MNGKRAHWNEISFYICMTRKNYYVKLLTSLYKKFIQAMLLKKNENNTLYLIAKLDSLYGFIGSLQSNSLTQLKVLNDICIIDYPEKLNRFEVNYNLLSVKYNFRFFVKCYTSAYISSVSGIFNSANWIEREC